MIHDSVPWLLRRGVCEASGGIVHIQVARVLTMINLSNPHIQMLSAEYSVRHLK